MSKSDTSQTSASARPSTPASGNAVPTKHAAIRDAAIKDATIKKADTKKAEIKRATTIPFPVVGIGASAGGLEAVQAFLSTTKDQTGLAFVLVQHLDPNHQSMLADLLSRRTPMRVAQAEDGDRLEPDTLFVIPPGSGLALEGRTLRLVDFAEPRGLRRPIDDFFVSLSEACGGNAACVILSGTGGDGSAGLRAVKDAGGIVLVQEPDDARYDGMPTSAIATRVVDRVAPAVELLPAIRDYFDNGRGVETGSVDDVLDSLETACAVLSETIGHDFSDYKQATMMRRIRRRMKVLGVDTAQTYVERLRGNTAECESLLTDLLINVTEFFRDAESFQRLLSETILPMVDDANRSDTLRVWVPGCSSGEEPYTLALMIAHALRDTPNPPFVQIFATDIDEQMLAIAKLGRYPVSALATIPKHYHDYLDVRATGHFTVQPDIRDMVRFSSHSLIKDPPFSRLDLISCRNLLIYFNSRLQTGVLPLFHYALKPDGTLFLGPAESIGARDDLFEPISARHRIFRRKGGRTPEMLNLPLGGTHSLPTRRRTRPVTTTAAASGIVQQRLIDAYTPSYIVVGETGEISESSGQLAKYFDIPAGAMTRHVASLARPGLRSALTTGLRTAMSERKRTVQRDIEIASEFGTQTADIVADPLPDGSTLIVIRDVAAFRARTDDDLIPALDADTHRETLQTELDSARTRLRTLVEELETTNEELKSSNEEMMSMNEELQSANEELTTVNDELKSKIDKLAVANTDQRNFLAATDLALVVLDPDLTIRMFTDPAREIYDLNDSDIGRPLSAFTANVTDATIIPNASRVLETGKETARHVMSRDGERAYAMRLMPYYGANRGIEGVSLTFANITQLREARSVAEDAMNSLELALAVTGVGVWHAVPETGESVCDAAVREMFDLPKNGALLVEDVLDQIDPRDVDRVDRNFKEAIDKGISYRVEFRVRDTTPERWLVGEGRMVDNGTRIMGVNYDITPFKAAAREQALLVRELDHRVKNLFAVTLGMLRSEARRTSDTGALIKNIESRLAALSRAHDASRGGAGYTETSLKRLVELVLEPYGIGETVHLRGQDVRLHVQTTTPLGLVLHELATNSQKYGALSVPDGTIRVSWEAYDNAVHLRWLERDGPDVSPPPERKPGQKGGFGMRLIQQSVQQLQGRVELDWDPRGLELEIILPVFPEKGPNTPQG